LNYYEHHLGDYMRDTAHLSMVEDCAYRRLLDAYYGREKPLPADLRDCCKLARATSKGERDAVAYVLREFFQLAEDGHHQGRADAEIERFKDKQRKAKASADARWSQRETQSEGNANASTDAMRTHMRTQSEGNAPRARPQTPVTKHQPSTRGTGERERASRLPPGWDPGEAGYAFAASQGLVGSKVAQEKPGKDGTKLDWQATWRTWVRRSVEFAPKGQPAPDDIFAGAR
jgi:uncharacterized protein YdaU (DUF1376 family)